MTPHVKPTKEELEANAQQALEDLKKLEDVDKEEDNESENTKEEENKEVVEVPDDKQVDEGKDKEVETPTETEEVKEEIEKPKPKTDIEKKLLNSTREAQILYARNKQVQDAISKAAEIPEATEEELKIEFSNWDDLDDFSKKMARDSYQSKRFQQSIMEVNKHFKSLEAWEGKVTEFIEDPGTLVNDPSLEGREEEFKIFATKPTRIGVDFDVLVAAFQYELNKSKPEKKKGKMLESGNGGEKSKPAVNDGSISVDEASILRKTDFRKYMEYVKSKKIRVEL